MPYYVVCSRCGSRQESPLHWCCPACGGPWRLDYTHAFDVTRVRRGDRSLWRFRDALPFETSAPVTLGEGGTPLIAFDRHLHLKLDFLMPTGSFKDRGSAVLLTHVQEVRRQHAVHRVTEDSSGNAGASIAAYAARAGLACRVFTPETVAPAKARQIEAYGAELVRVTGSREQVSAAAQQAEPGSWYISHVWHPFFALGMRTIAYELAEAWGWKAPDVVLVPVSVGTLLMGLIDGFHDLVAGGVIPTPPRVIGVQTEQVAPVHAAFHGLPYTPPPKVTSVADALISTRPVQLEAMVHALRSVRGDTVVVRDSQILAAQTELASRGIYVEPSAATSYAAWKTLEREGKLAAQDVVLVLTGSGLKTGG